MTYSRLPTMLARMRLAAALGAVAATGACALAAASPAWAGTAVFTPWCGDWDANPGSAASVSTIDTHQDPDGSIAEIQWGSAGGNEYAWAKLTGDTAHGDTIALYWEASWPPHGVDTGPYQCGDSHGYDDATVWPNATETWTAGVPIGKSPRPGDAIALGLGYIVWNAAGERVYTSPPYTAPQLSSFPAVPVQSAPSSVTPLAGGSSPTTTPPAVHRHRVTVILRGSRRRLLNGQRIRLGGHVVGSVGRGVMVELQGSVATRPRRWTTFGFAVTNSRGSFHSAYRFRATPPPGNVYALRAVLPAQRSDSYGAGTSRAIIVHVRN